MAIPDWLTKTTWMLRSGRRTVQLPDGTDEDGARRYARQWAVEVGNTIEIWFEVDGGEAQHLGPPARECDALCRDVEADRDRLHALLGEVACALELALRGEHRATCERVLARAREVLS